MREEENVHQNQNDETIKMCGYLQKKRKQGFVIRWKKCWCILQDQLLLCYKSRTEYYRRLSPCCGSLNMTLVRTVNVGRNNNNCHIHIETHSQFIVLKAKNKENQIEWLRALTEAISRNQKISHQFQLNKMKEKFINEKMELKLPVALEGIKNEVEKEENYYNKTSSSISNNEEESLIKIEYKNKLDDVIMQQERHLVLDEMNINEHSSNSDITVDNEKIVLEEMKINEHSSNSDIPVDNEKIDPEKVLTGSGKLLLVEYDDRKTGLMSIISESTKNISEPKPGVTSCSSNAEIILTNPKNVLTRNRKSLSFERLNRISDFVLEDFENNNNNIMRSYSFRVNGHSHGGHSPIISPESVKIRNYSLMNADQEDRFEKPNNSNFEVKNVQKSMKHHFKRNGTLTKAPLNFLKKFLPKRNVELAIGGICLENAVFEVEEDVEKNDLSLDNLDVFTPLSEKCTKIEAQIDKNEFDETADSRSKKESINSLNASSCSINIEQDMVDSNLENVRISKFHLNENFETKSMENEISLTSEGCSLKNYSLEFQLNQNLSEITVFNETLEKITDNNNNEFDTDNLNYQLNQIFTVSSLTNEFLENSFNEYELISLSNNCEKSDLKSEENFIKDIGLEKANEIDHPKEIFENPQKSDSNSKKLSNEYFENFQKSSVKDPSDENRNIEKLNSKSGESNYSSFECEENKNGELNLKFEKLNSENEKNFDSLDIKESSSSSSLSCSDCQSMMEKVPILPMKKRSRSPKKDLNLQYENSDADARIIEIVKNKNNNSSHNLDMLLMQLLVINGKNLNNNANQIGFPKNEVDYDIPRTHSSALIGIFKKNEEPLEMIRETEFDDYDSSINDSMLESVRISPDSLEAPWTLYNKPMETNNNNEKYANGLDCAWNDEFNNSEQNGQYPDSLNPVILPK